MVAWLHGGEGQPATTTVRIVRGLALRCDLAIAAEVSELILRANRQHQPVEEASTGTDGV